MSFQDNLNSAADKLSAAVTAVQFVENIAAQTPTKMSSADKLNAALTIIGVLNPTIGAIEGVICAIVSLFNTLGIFTKTTTTTAQAPSIAPTTIINPVTSTPITSAPIEPFDPAAMSD
jgi:hypothetical protein